MPSKWPSLESCAGGRGVSEARRSPQPASHRTWVCALPFLSPCRRGKRPNAPGHRPLPSYPSVPPQQRRAPTDTPAPRSHGPPRPPRTHLLSAATVPASSNRQSWRLRASSRALGPGSCFQSSRSPLLRAMGAAGRGEEGAGVPVEAVAEEPSARRAHGAALGGRRQPRGSSSGRLAPAPAASPREAGREGGRAPLPLSGHLSRPPSASAAGAPSAGRRKRSSPRGRTRRCVRLLGEPRLRPAGRERPSPLLPALLFPPAVNFPESTLSLWLRGSGSSSSGTGRRRRRGAAPALAAGEGRSGGRAPEPGRAVGLARQGCSRPAVLLPTPAGGGGRRREPGARAAQQRLRRRSCSLGRRGCCRRCPG